MSSRTSVVCFIFLCLAASTLSAGEVRTFTIRFDETSLRTADFLMGDDTFQMLTMDDLEMVGRPGEPWLPAKSVGIYVPRGQQIERVSIQAVDASELPGTYLVLPAQQEIPLSEGFAFEPIPPDQAVYSQDGPFPDEAAVLASSGAIGGRKIATVQVFPVRYMPARRKVAFSREITLAVEFGSADFEPRVPRETAGVRKLRNSMAAALVENPEDLEADFPPDVGTLDPSAATEYLILCLESHADEYQVLRDWKTRKGVPAAIRTIEDVTATYAGRDEGEQLRNCIMDYYLNQSTAWVVLTLSAPKARIRGCYCSVGSTVDTGIPCDLYFSDMDGDWNQDNDAYWGETGDDVDLYPDVYVGRLPINKGVQCSTVVEKILTYEGYYALPADYQLDMLFMAEYADGSTDCSILKNMIDSESVPSRFDPITKLYESSGNLNKTSAMNALNSGMGIVNHAGHGNSNLLSIGPSALDTDDMLSLTNAPRYSVFYTLACDPGNFENPLGCFARAFVVAEDGGGFFVGNSRYGWYWPGMPGYGTGDRYDREFFESIFVRGQDHLGTAHADAKVQRIPYSGDNDTDRWTQFSLNLFGDPETPIWLDTPVAFSISHPESVETGNSVFDVTAYGQGSPVSEARVCLWKGDEVYEVTYTDGSGDAHFQISPTDAGPMLVTVSKNGYLPYAGSMPVVDGLSGISRTGDPAARLWVRVVPNPVSGSARITYSIPTRAGKDEPDRASLEIFDVAGRLVWRGSASPVDDAVGTLAWDRRLASGRTAPGGIYFAKISHGRDSSTTKFVILR